MQIITYYTEDPIYSAHIKNFHNSLLKINNTIPVYIESIKPFSSWSDATNYKPKFIKRCLQEFKEPVLWVDADAIVHGGLEYFNTLDCDMACHFRHKKELLTGTIYFQPTTKAFELIDKWIELVEQNSKKWEQRNLQTALAFVKDVRIEKLDAKYTTIYDIMRRTGEVKGDCYIEHFQASRISNPDNKRRVKK